MEARRSDRGREEPLLSRRPYEAGRQPARSIGLAIGFRSTRDCGFECDGGGARAYASSVVRSTAAKREAPVCFEMRPVPGQRRHLRHSYGADVPGRVACDLNIYAATRKRKTPGSLPGVKSGTNAPSYIGSTADSDSARRGSTPRGASSDFKTEVRFGGPDD